MTDNARARLVTLREREAKAKARRMALRAARAAKVALIAWGE